MLAFAHTFASEQSPRMQARNLKPMDQSQMALLFRTHHQMRRGIHWPGTMNSRAKRVKHRVTFMSLEFSDGSQQEP